jgi:hypothetical protein
MLLCTSLKNQEIRMENYWLDTALDTTAELQNVNN